MERFVIINDLPAMGGMGVYAFCLYDRLKKLCEVDHLFLDCRGGRFLAINETGVTTTILHKYLPSLRSAFLDKAYLHTLLYFSKFPKYSLYHIANQNLSLLRIQPKVITCHDLARVRFSPRHRPLFSILLRGLKHAKMIIAPSRSTKLDIVNYYGLPPERVRVIYEGVDREIFSPLMNLDIRRELGVDEGCFLIMHVGPEIEDKNVGRLIEAVFLLKEKLPVRLLRVGRQSKEIRKKIHELGLEREIIYVEGVSSRKLAQMYSVADVFAFPSLYEGFGLPLLEAMACGCPVMASNTSSLPEVVGDAGMLVDPYDVNGFSKAMYEVLMNDELRKEMIRKGLKRAQTFTWERAAKETLQVYEESLS